MKKKGRNGMYMKLKDGKSKVLTLSYDDGVMQDIRLMEIMDRYGIKGTFNINSGLYREEDFVREKPRGRMKLSEAKKAYINSGHEIAVHGYKHLSLALLKPDEIIQDVMDDRRNIEREYKTIARGMAYANGSFNDTVIKCLEMCGICYCRTTKKTEGFGFPENWLALNPTCHHNHPELMEMAQKFVEDPCTRSPMRNRMFYLWGHSYEFDNDDNWHVIEEFCEYVGNKEDIWYATNIEIYDYVMAYNSLQADVDRKIVYNPSAIDVWFMQNGETYCVKSGETIYL